MSVGSGLFITFEGGEGAGKSTQIRLLAAALRERGHDVLTTREPGGSDGAEAVRHVLLSGAAQHHGIRMEAILFAAARSDHVEEVIRPALQRGAIVLCDRFMDSSRVYQGITGNLDPIFVDTLERIAVNGVRPDLTLIFDLAAAVGLERVRRRAGDRVVREAADGTGLDRFELEALATHEKRREAFLDIAEREPDRCHVIDATGPVAAIADAVLSVVAARLPAGADLRRSTSKGLTP